MGSTGAGDWVSKSVQYVAPRAAEAGDPWSEETAAQGRNGTQRIVEAGTAKAPDGVARLLGLPEESDVIVRRRIMLLDGEPFELTDTYYPLRIARGTPLAETRKIPGGAVALLAELGHVGARVQEDVRARMPSPDEAAALAIEALQPVLRLTRLTLDRNDNPIQVDMMVMPGHRQTLRYELRID